MSVEDGCSWLSGQVGTSPSTRHTEFHFHRSENGCSSYGRQSRSYDQCGHRTRQSLKVNISRSMELGVMLDLLRRRCGSTEAWRRRCCGVLWSWLTGVIELC